MIFSCLKDKLEYAVGIAERFTSRNTSLPVLENILLETRTNSLTLTSTNLEYAARVTVSGNGTGEERLIIPAKIFNALLQSINDSKIELGFKKNTLCIKTPSLGTKLNGYGGDDFPIIPRVTSTADFAIEAALLAQGLEKVIPAVSTSEFKPELNGVYFKITPARLYLAATDTFRLAEKTIALSKRSEDRTHSFILPQKVARELIRVLSQAETEDTRLVLGENQILFSINGIEITSRLIEGNFPEYNSIIPKEFETNCFINKAEAAQAVRTSSIFSSRLSNVLLEFNQKHLNISSVNPEVGEHSAKIPASLSGKDSSIQFNHRFLLDGINAIDEEEILFGVNNENTPAVIRNKSDGSFLYLIMPLKIS